MALIPVIVMMEDAGIGFSPSRLIKERRAMERKLIQLEEEATRIMGHPVLLTSPQQLCSVLFEELRLPPPKNEGEVCI
jgi:DNA polymerase-1